MNTVSIYQLDAAKKVRPWALVDFMSPSCGPCQRMPPVLQQIQARFPVWVVAVDVEEDPGMANSRYRVNSVPTVVLYQYGQERTRKVGAFLISDALRSFGPFFR